MLAASTVSILAGDGSGGLTLFGSPIAVGAGPAGVAAGHVNSDPFLDLAVANRDDGSVSVLLGDGTGGFSSAGPAVPVGAMPWGLALADFNGDHNLDIVTANHGSGDVSVLDGNGDGTFQAAQNTLTGGTGPAGVVVGRFDANLSPDLAVTNYQSDNVSSLLNQQTPVMGVQGNGIAIADGDSTPSATDGTDFGSAPIGTGVTHTFTIQNTGDATLNLDGSPLVQLSDTTNFSIVNAPAASVPPGGSTTFQVNFAPTTSGPHTTTLSIPNDDSNNNPYQFTIQGTGAAPPALSISSVNQNEGNSGTTPFVFNVTLSAADAQPVTVQYATQEVTATVADNDYVAAIGTLTFDPGTTTQTITVLVNGDTFVESDETFTVKLSNASANATIATGTGTGTIVNDDPLTWQNSRNPLDVSDDAHVTPLDALIVINQLNANGPEVLPQPATPPPFFDVSGDGALTPLDALLVANFLNEDQHTPLNPVGPSVSITLATTDLNGNPISTIPVGSDFKVTATLNDLRTSNPSGAFAAYLDVAYDPSLLTIPVGTQIVFDSFYSNVRAQDLSVPGNILESGAVGGLSPPGPSPQLLGSVILHAAAAGSENFQAAPATALGHDVLLYGNGTAVPTSQVQYVGASIAITAPTSHADLQITNTDGQTTAIPLRSPTRSWSPTPGRAP